MADSIGNIYGNALFEVCCEENCLDEVYGELGSIRDILFSLRVRRNMWSVSCVTAGDGERKRGDAGNGVYGQDTACYA